MASSARIDELRKKFEENPRRYFAPLANEYRKAGQIDQAIAICREYLPQQPGHMSGHIVYGQALYEARQFEEAKGVFETALALDPENLIALRHLGDIALLIGDSEAARTWYRRVLEADPRNEEIQAQLLTLEQSAVPSSSAVESQARNGGADGSSARTVALDTAPTPAAVPTQAPRPSGEVRRQPWARKTPVPPMSPGASSAPTPPSIPAAQPSASAAISSAKTVEVPRRVDPATSASQPTPPSVPAIELDSPVAGGSPATPETVPIETASVAGLETTSLTASVPAPEPPLQAAPAEKPGATERADSALPRLSLLDLPAVTADAPPTAPESGPFVTETMAELYLQQGHKEEALRVYRALAEQRPDNATLRDRVATLEAELTLPAARSAAPADASQTTREPRASGAASGAPRASAEARAAESGGPSIREVLETIALRRPGFRPERSSGNGATPARSDGLASLFGNASIAASDEGAALVLALAFTELQNGAPLDSSSPLEGAPAHRASNELSLAAVFGTGQGAPAGTNVSYDQFFAQRPSGGTAGSDAEDDVASFNRWLEGLTRR